MAKHLLDHKLAAYAMAGGVASLALPVTANASVIYFAGPALSITGVGSSTQLDLNGDSLNDFTFSIGQSGALTSMTVTPLGTSHVADSGGYAALYAPGDLIDASASFVGTPRDLATYKAGPGYAGNWPNDGTPGYLGLSFDLSGETYYGWAQVGTNFSSTTLSVYDWAYNDTPATGLDAGVPEPSTLGLFCLGAAGVLALRRRKQRAG